MTDYFDSAYFDAAYFDTPDEASPTPEPTSPPRGVRIGPAVGARPRPTFEDELAVLLL